MAAIPVIVAENGTHRVLVDGAPFLLLGAQVRNSSTAPDDLAKVWPQAVALNANTIEVPVPWNLFEPEEGEFDYSVVDTILEGARTHSLRVMLLWFGTWKNGTCDYAPDWVKQDLRRFPRALDPAGAPVRVLSPHSEETLRADTTAFTMLMRHLASVDSGHRTVIMVQVENEPGSLFTVRDHSAEADAIFDAPVPPEIGGDGTATWAGMFGPDADETFSAFHTAEFVEQVAAAGKAEYPLPLSVNVWLRERKSWSRPAEQYPSGGPTSNMLDLWLRLTPSIDAICPDTYIFDHAGFEETCRTYGKPENPLIIPETFGMGHFVTYPFLAFADHQALGLAPFGFDSPYGAELDDAYTDMAATFGMLGPAAHVLDEVRGTGRARAAVEQPNNTSTLLEFEHDHVLVQWGGIISHYGGEYALGSSTGNGRVIVIDHGDNEYFVMGFDSRVRFRPAPGAGSTTEFLNVERGTWEDGVWLSHGAWNGDETFFGLQLPPTGETLRVRVQRY